MDATSGAGNSRGRRRFGLHGSRGRPNNRPELEVAANDKAPNADAQGTNSTVFTFAGEGLTATFSVDGYYPEWHDLAYCYTALDWKLKSQQNYKDASTENHATQLSLYTDDGQYSVSYFSCFDSQMQSVKPGEATIGVIPTFSVLMERMPWSTPVDLEKAKIVPPIFQLQLMCSSSHELLDYERENLQRLFSVLSQHALQSFTKASP